MDLDLFDDETNVGFVKRSAMIKDSTICQLYGPLNLDFFRQSRYLLSNTSMRITFTLNKPEFLLNAYDKALNFKDEGGLYLVM